MVPVLRRLGDWGPGGSASPCVEIDLVEPARLGDRLVATAREVLVRGRSGIYDVSVTRAGDDGPVMVAVFRGRSRSSGRSIR